MTDKDTDGNPMFPPPGNVPATPDRGGIVCHTCGRVIREPQPLVTDPRDGKVKHESCVGK